MADTNEHLFLTMKCLFQVCLLTVSTDPQHALGHQTLDCQERQLPPELTARKTTVSCETVKTVRCTAQAGHLGEVDSRLISKRSRDSEALVL
jgi:hypothetical protein